LNGGYDEGYSQCHCFWGRSPGSLVRTFLSKATGVRGLRVLDLGCGEGKNAYAFAKAGATVTAVDCSKLALDNAKRELAHPAIEWVQADAESYVREHGEFDIVIMYGLLHCLKSIDDIQSVVSLALRKTRPSGYHIVAAFNDGSHDLRAHPGFKPTLASHAFYLNIYRSHTILHNETDVIHEIHPHNGLPHHHSLTRVVARKMQ